MTRAVEVVLAVVLTAELLPVLLLYGLDVAAGTVPPGAERALFAVVGIVGLWVALVSSEALMLRQPMLRWGTAAALTVAAALGISLVWDVALGESRAAWLTGMTAGAGGAAAVHQGIRLVRL